jgi:hypothetical protein
MPNSTRLPHRRSPPRLALLAALALPLAERPAMAQSAFGPAETLSYTCKYLGIPVGNIHMMLGNDTSIGGQSVWPVMALAKTDPLFILYPVRDRYVTWWSPTAHQTIGNDLSAEEKNKRRHERVRFDRLANRASTTREREGLPPEEQVYDVEAGSQDILSAFFTIREKRLAVGDHEEIPIFTGKRSFTLKLDVKGKEAVEVAAGRFDTLVLNVQVQFAGKLESKRDIKVWVTNDVHHIPVRVDAEFLIGSLVADLTTYQKGITRAAAPAITQKEEGSTSNPALK